VPYRIRHIVSKTLKLTSVYLTCTHIATPDTDLFQSQRFAYRVDQILWHEQLRDDKGKCIGLLSWLKPGDIPITALFSGLDKLAKSYFTSLQKADYSDLKDLWNRTFVLCVDRNLLMVYIHSVLAIKGLVLREKLLHDDFIEIITHQEKISLKSKAEFGKKEVDRVIKELTFLISNRVDRVEFNRLAFALFSNGYQITIPLKDQLEELFMNKVIPGGNKHDY
jgi:hypothetical protein